MTFIIELLQYAFWQMVHTLAVNWPFLVISVFVSAAIKLYADQERVANFLKKNRKGGVAIATATAVATPLCSCGTTAVVLGMMASVMPWAPIIAFMVASPLTSPEELIYSAGLFGWKFAIAFFVASIILGLIGGALGGFAESRGWLNGQARMARPETPSLSLNVLPGQAAPVRPRVTFKMFMQESFNTGKRLMVLFLGFAFIGYLLNGLIPAEWIASLFGEGRVYGIPLAATLGLPFYLNTEASLPLVRAMLDSGMSQGAALSFLITGAGTSIGAMGGALTIARWRVIAIIIGTLWAGSIVLGFAYNLFI